MSELASLDFFFVWQCFKLGQTAATAKYQKLHFWQAIYLQAVSTVIPLKMVIKKIQAKDKISKLPEFVEVCYSIT